MPYTHFTIEDRDALQVLKGYSLEVWVIARILGKHPSSIYRELSRNVYSGIYLSHRADSAARKRREQSRERPKRGNPLLMKKVEQLVRQDISPEQIAGRLKLEHPNDPSWHVSHETIYQHVYSKVKQGTDLRMHLRQAHKKRRKRLSSKDKRGIIPNRTFIDNRPAIVEQKVRIGDWEGDTVEGGSKKGYIVTYVDRATKYLIARIVDHKTADNIVKASQKAFSAIPVGYKRTITVDNGKEFARHSDLACVTGAEVYFAHPYHSWERGLNEHTNGLLRQYFPKKLPLDKITPRQLARAVEKLNNRPRKALGYLTPREAFHGKTFALRT